MSGTSRSMSVSAFFGLRVGRTTFTPEYSKNGQNVSAKLVINAYMNIPSRANGGEGRSEVFPLTVWGKLAHTCAKAMSPGKEFNTIAQLHVYNGRVFAPSGQPNVPGTPILGSDGQPLMTKKFSFTIMQLTFGDESDKQINAEIQAKIRPIGWNVKGSAEAAQWAEILKARMAVQFDPNLPTYGYARVVMPQGPGIGAYIQNAAQPVAATPAQTGNTGVVIPGVNPAAPVAQPVVATPAVNPGGFVVPAGV